MSSTEPSTTEPVSASRATPSEQDIRDAVGLYRYTLRGMLLHERALFILHDSKASHTVRHQAGLSQLVYSQKMKFFLIGYIEAGCWTVADKKETVTTSATSKPAQIVIKLALIALGLDLNPVGFFGQSLADDKINVGLVLAENCLSTPAVVVEEKIDHRRKIFPVQLSVL